MISAHKIKSHDNDSKILELENDRTLKSFKLPIRRPNAQHSRLSEMAIDGERDLNSPLPYSHFYLANKRPHFYDFTKFGGTGPRWTFRN